MITNRQKSVVAALLSGSSVAEAARQTGVGESSIRRWLRDDPGFIAVLDKAADDLIRDAVTTSGVSLARVTSKAIKAIEEALDGRSKRDRLKASALLLDKLIAIHRLKTESPK